MELCGNKYYRCIYAYEFEDNSVYVGLTFNLEKRNKQHLSVLNSPVFLNIQKTKSIPILIQLTEYISIDDAKINELEFIKKYKIKGWTLLNKMKAGGTGGIRKWNKQMCIEEAAKYTNKSDYIKNSKSYKIAYLYEWTNEIYNLMGFKIRKSPTF